MGIDLNNLNGPQRRIVREALLAAYNEATLDQMLQDKLDRPPCQYGEAGAVRSDGFRSNPRLEAGRLDRATHQGSGKQFAEPKDCHARETLARSAAIEKKVSTKGRSLERLVRDGGFDDLSLWVDTLADMRRKVCRVEVTDAGERRFGTGFLVAADLLLTNYHVIEKGAGGTLAGDDIRCHFDLTIDEQVQSPGKIYALASDWLVAHSPYSDHDPGDQGGLPDAGELDYALLRLAQPVGEEVVANKPRGWVSLVAAEPPKTKDILLIVQHPKGEPLKLAVGAVQKLNDNGTRILYDANTENGSSGSPCLDARLRLTALHHGGDPDYGKLMGDFNQGIPIGRIVADILAKGVAVPPWKPTVRTPSPPARRRTPVGLSPWKESYLKKHKEFWSLGRRGQERGLGPKTTKDIIPLDGRCEVKSAGRGQPKPQTLTTFFAKRRGSQNKYAIRIHLFGPPGAGKTVSVTRFLYDLAQDALEKGKRGDNDDIRIPLIFEAASLSNHLPSNEHEVLSTRLLIKSLSVGVEASDLDIFENDVSGGRYYCVFDDIDQVDDDIKRRLWWAVFSFANNTSSDIVVVSREHPPEEPGIYGRFMKIEVQPLRKEQGQDLARRWADTEQTETAVYVSLMDKIYDDAYHAGYSRMSMTPIMLTGLCVVAGEMFEGGELPSGDGQLLEKWIDTLCSKRGSGEHNHLDKDEGIMQRIKILGLLAEECRQTGERSIKKRRAIDLIKLDGCLVKRWDIDLILRDVMNTGILYQKGKSLYFHHLLHRDYLSATHLATKYGAVEDLVTDLCDNANYNFFDSQIFDFLPCALRDKAP